jgi:hypothetical protein
MKNRIINAKYAKELSTAAESLELKKILIAIEKSASEGYRTIYQYENAEPYITVLSLRGFIVERCEGSKLKISW